jgi:hypothetical protein
MENPYTGSIDFEMVSKIAFVYFVDLSFLHCSLELWGVIRPERLRGSATSHSAGLSIIKNTVNTYFATKLAKQDYSTT